MKLEPDGNRHGNAGQMVTRHSSLESTVFDMLQRRLIWFWNCLFAVVGSESVGLRGYAGRGEPADLYFEEYRWGAEERQDNHQNALLPKGDAVHNGELLMCSIYGILKVYGDILPCNRHAR